MMRLEDYIGTKSSPVAQLAMQNMRADSGVEVNVSSMPQTKPNVQWDPGYVRIEWTTGELIVDWDAEYGPDVTVTPHSVEIRVAGKNEVKITVNEEKVARSRGKKVNRRI
ncbi:MAG TPA: hypothetical protein DEB31_07015 [Clostridiales bacterium]|nr:hypothetical protein [Clostridiales bacterium]